MICSATQQQNHYNSLFLKIPFSSPAMVTDCACYLQRHQYLFGMLGTLRRFYAEHVRTCPGGPSPARPKPNLYYERHEYQQLLHRATHLSRVASASEPWILPPFSHPEKLERAAEICGLTGDAAPFWDTKDFREPFVSP